jgi:hypothetical protein
VSTLRRVVLYDRPSPVVVTGIACATIYLIVLGWAMSNVSFDVWGAFVIAPALVAITIPIATRIARQESDPRMMKLVMAALACKMVGALVRYFVAFSVYNGNDSTDYHNWGRKLAPMFRDGDFTVNLGRKVIGTGFIEILTGVVYTFTGATKLGGFLVFSYLGFWGLYFFYRAFRVAVPHGDHRRYALVVFFFPSLLFWPSSIGKESWMMFCLGILAYGVARVLVGQRGGVPLVVLGMLGTIMVRPHVALIAMIALITAFALRRSRRPSILAGPAKLAGLALLLLAASVVLTQTESFLGVKKFDQQSVEHVLKDTTRKSSEAGTGSTFEAAAPTSPVEFGRAAIDVIFRPWPYEARNLGSLLASLEGLIMLGLVLTSLPRLAALPREVLRTPYVAFALVFALLFIFAFSSISNFGNIARQRVQLFPFLLVLLCIPFPPRGDANRRRFERRTVSTGRKPTPVEIRR